MHLLRTRHQRNHGPSLLCLILTLISVTSWIALPSHAWNRQAASDPAKEIEPSTPAGPRVPVSIPPTPNQLAQARVKEAYGSMPLSFEANRGQADPQVKFLSHGNGHNLFLTSAEMVLVLSKHAEQESRKVSLAERKSVENPASKSSHAVTRLKLAGANPQSPAAGLLELDGRSNYFTGRDPKQWHTGIPNYARVTYQGIYPGVDLVYYGNQQQLEYDFVVAPGTDPHVIALETAGADKIEIDRQGDLLLSIKGGQLRQRKPLIYQEVDGVRKFVTGRYILRNQHQVGFQVDAYDHEKPLVIDPVLVYSTYLAGSGSNEGTSIAVDPAGNAYVTGVTDSLSFPTTTGAFKTNQSGGRDVFVTKINAAGSTLSYSTYLGGSLDDEGYGIAVDTAGNAYVAGTTASPNFPTTTGALQTTNNGATDAFVTKLNATGSALVYSTYLGGSGYEEGFGIAVNPAGNAYVTGLTTSSNFTTTSGALHRPLRAGQWTPSSPS